MCKLLRNLVVKTKSFFSGLVRRPFRANYPILSTVWDELPYSFGTDWYTPYGDYHLKPVCNCYYCRRRTLEKLGFNSGPSPRGSTT